MVESAEIRWILPGYLPPGIFDQFTQSHLLSYENFREDVYLKFPASSTVGVKFRKSNFEIKPLVNSLGIFEINERVAGEIELWEKWSISSQEVQSFFQAAIKEQRWVTVGKERWIRTFTINSETSEVVADTSPDRGCNVELSKINFEDKSYWSLAFETFGEFKSQEEVLKQVTIYFFDKILTKVPFDLSTGKEASFSISYSCSYPLWLQNH